MLKLNQIVDKISKEKYIVPAIFTLGLSLRIFGSTQVGLAFDERLWLNAANQISLSPKNFNLVFHGVFHPFFEVYLVKLSTILFGNNLLDFMPYYRATRLSVRLLHAILCSGTILIIYYLVKDGLGKIAAIFAALFLAFSQFHIHFSRTVIQTAPLLFFVSLSLLFFWKAVNQNKNKYIVYTGLSIGLGYLCEETSALLFLIFAIFLIITKRFIPWIKKKETYFAILVFLILISPDLYWNFLSQSSNIKYHLTRAASFKGPSLLPLSLFIGELFLIGVKDLESFTGGFGRNAVWSLEYPPMHWILGLLCLFALIYSFWKRKNEFVCLMQISFFTIFLFFTVFASQGPFGNFNFWWASICFIPAIILVSDLFSQIYQKNLFFKLFAVTFVFYLFCHSIFFLSIRENVYVRRPSFLAKYFINSGRLCLLRGETDWAIDNFKNALKYEPRSLSAMVNLAECYKRKDQHQKAAYLEKNAQEKGIMLSDSKRLLLDNGYLKEWLIYGYYKKSDLDNHRINDSTILSSLSKLKMGQDMKGNKYEKIVSSSAFIDLKMALKSPPNTYSYAFTQIYSPVKQRVMLLVGADDGLTIWLNREKVYENNEKFIWFPDEDKRNVNLNQGWNDLFLKVFYDKGKSYGFTIRLADDFGKIIENIKYFDSEHFP